MTLQEVKETYNSLIDEKSTKLSAIKKSIFQIGTIRLIIVLGCIALCYLFWGNNLILFSTIFISIVGFLFLLKYHNKLFVQKRYYELLIENAKNELKGIDYDFSSFDGKSDKADADHSYSNDLDIFGEHSFFQSLNRTVTRYGKDHLTDTILYPFDNKSDIINQQQAIKELSQKQNLINHFRAIGQLSEMGDLDVHYFSQQFLQTKLLTDSWWKYMSYIIPILSLIAFALYLTDILSTTGFIIYWVVCGFICSTPIKEMKRKIGLFEKKFDLLQTYADLFKIIEDENFKSQFLTNLQQIIKQEEVKASSAIQQLKSYSDNFDQSFTIIGLLFLNPFLMWNITYSIKIEKWLFKHKEDIASWFNALGKFDSLLSFALYAYNHPDYTYPTVSDKQQLNAKGLGHPLIDRNICVRNDIDIAKSPYFLVITGANMAGKSTYLRTVGINLTLACTGSVVCASEMEFYPYHLVTNLRTSDSLAENESYFFAELKRLKMIIDRLQSGEELFIILDEILKGTNSEDKQKGSMALMKQLITLQGNGIIATHDLLLGNLEKEYPNEIKNYRFEADIKDDQLSFTYKIREGVAQNMNASFLMKKMGITGL